jgi:hypothetical protein
MTSKRQAKAASTKPTPRLFWVTYSSTKPTKIEKNDEYQHPKLFQERDGAAFIELAHAPLLHSYSYEAFIHLYPGHRSPLEAFPKFHSGDLLVLTTRPPLSDVKWFAKVDSETKIRKNIFQSECALEEILFNEMRKYFASCLRTGLKLSDGAASLVSKDRHKWKEVEFQEYSPRNNQSDHSEHGASKNTSLLPD